MTIDNDFDVAEDNEANNTLSQDVTWYSQCDLGMDNFHADATCSFVPGGFDCTCNTGFTGDGVSCAGVNECATGCQPLSSADN